LDFGVHRYAPGSSRSFDVPTRFLPPATLLLPVLEMEKNGALGAKACTSLSAGSRSSAMLRLWRLPTVGGAVSAGARGSVPAPVVPEAGAGPGGAGAMSTSSTDPLGAYRPVVESVVVSG
jgi:hypothetical protein